MLSTFLPYSIEQFIPDANVTLVRAEVLSAHFKSHGTTSETGKVTLRTRELYRGTAPKNGETFEIEGQRTADAERRPLDILNMWNSCAFAPHEELLLALALGRSATIFSPLAAIDSQANAASLKEAVAIEALPIPARLARIKPALQSENHLLQNYVLTALRVPGTATREQAALALAEAFTATHPREACLSLFAELETPPYVDLKQGPDPANRAILSALMHAIPREPLGERQREWINHLAAKLGSDITGNAEQDQALRSRLIAALSTSEKAPLTPLLLSAQAAHPDDLRLKRLIEAWK